MSACFVLSKLGNIKFLYKKYGTLVTGQPKKIMTFSWIKAGINMKLSMMKSFDCKTY